LSHSFWHLDLLYPGLHQANKQTFCFWLILCISDQLFSLPRAASNCPQGRECIPQTLQDTIPAPEGQRSFRHSPKTLKRLAFYLFPTESTKVFWISTFNCKSLKRRWSWEGGCFFEKPAFVTF
jgi:hypothetical protein